MAQHGSWEQQAANWVAWARTPDHDVFQYFSPLFIDEILPQPFGPTLEVGCGEGRVARLLTSVGHAVIAIDGSPTLVKYAQEAQGGAAFLVANAIALPFPDASFGTVVAYNSLQTMANLSDMEAAVSEAARVVRSDGHVCICVAHPFSDFLLVNEARGPESGDGSPSYFEHQDVSESVTKAGLTMTFHGWTYTLADFAGAIERAGMVIDRIREPVPNSTVVATRPELERWRSVPLFLLIRAVKR
jgi:SAM-dependent methyltransferase